MKRIMFILLALAAILLTPLAANAGTVNCGPAPAGLAMPYMPYGGYPGAAPLGLPFPALAPLPYVPPVSPVLAGTFNGTSLTITPTYIRTPGWVYAQAALSAQAVQAQFAQAQAAQAFVAGEQVAYTQAAQVAYVNCVNLNN